MKKALVAITIAFLGGCSADSSLCSDGANVSWKRSFELWRMAEPNDINEALPDVLLIGDSISIGYTPTVRRLLEGRANVYRVPDNAAHTCYGAKHLDDWLEGRHWDVVHFNWGLHDLKLHDGVPAYSVSEYRSSLSGLVRRIQSRADVAIWASTTPVPDGAAARAEGSEAAYNRAADEVMRSHGAPINNLHDVDAEQIPNDVHYTKAGYDSLGRQVAEVVGNHL